MRVLAVGACVVSPETLKLELAASGHDLVIMHTAREAFVLGPPHRPEVVVSQLFMEGEDAHRWWRKLRSHLALAEARFLGVVERYDAATVRVARETDYDYVLAAPVDLYALDEYLVGVSSPRWRRHPAGAHPWPPVNGGLPLPSIAAMPGARPGEEMLADFLRAMRDRAEQQPSTVHPLCGSLEIPPDVLLRHLDVVKSALESARTEDAQRGCRMLQDELVAATSAPCEAWSPALCERYRLALTTYRALFGQDGAHPE